MKEMTLEEAIRILSSGELERPWNRTDLERAAIQLGIEALERCRSNYLKPQCADFRRLPSETEGET